MKLIVKKCCSLFFWGFLFLVCVPSWAMMNRLDMTITEKDMVEQNRNSLPDLDAGEAVDKAIEDYFSDRDITPGKIRQGGKIYYASKQVVAVTSESPQWAKARQLAFEQALLEARSRFVFDNFGRTVTESEKMLKQDDSSDNQKFSQDLSGVHKVVALWNKVIALGEATLDKWLYDLGVDPTQYNSIPAAKRKDLFVKKYISKTISNAMGKSSGLLPVQTFEGSDSSGATVIGLIMLYSPKLHQLANDIANQQPTMLQGKKGNPISRYIDLPEKTLTNQFGVRVVFDEQGFPVVLSFGQWGYSYHGDNRRRILRYRENAGDTADVKASEGLVKFINSQLSLNDKRKTGDVIENYLVMQGVNVSEKDISTIIDLSTKLIKSQASARMVGTRLVKKWSYKEPNGQEIIGRVRAWSEHHLNISNGTGNIKTQKFLKTNPTLDSGDSKVRNGAISVDPEESF